MYSIGYPFLNRKIELPIKAIRPHGVREQTSYCMAAVERNENKLTQICVSLLPSARVLEERKRGLYVLTFRL